MSGYRCAARLLYPPAPTGRQQRHEKCRVCTVINAKIPPAPPSPPPPPPPPPPSASAGPLRVLLVDDGAHRVALILDELTRQGHLVVGVVDSAVTIHDCVLRLQPDVVIVDAESPSRDTLENLATVSTACPRPVVVFSEDANQGVMQQALKAGVSAYVIAGLQPQPGRGPVERARAHARGGCSGRRRAAGPARQAGARST